MKEENGGQAYPRPAVVWVSEDGHQAHEVRRGYYGMSLRDRFAIAAMESGKWDNGERTFLDAALWCGSMADAMLEEKELHEDIPADPD